MPDRAPPPPCEPFAVATEPALMGPALLIDLVRWRESLARSIARNNLELRSDGIMTAVNRILFPLLLLRASEDLHVVPEGTVAGLGGALLARDIIRDLGPYADGLYADDQAPKANAERPGAETVVEERVLDTILAEIASPARRYDIAIMGICGLADVLTQYLTRTVRRSAAHMATIVDTHDTVLARGTVIPPHQVTGYLVEGAIRSARRNRSDHDVLPLRLFDPACSSGTLLLAAFRQLQQDAGGPALAPEERQEILTNSVFGLDLSPHAVAATRLVLLLDLLSTGQFPASPGGFRPTALSVLRDLRRTVLSGNALIGPEIVDDESWMFCPARDRHRLNPFAFSERFPEIVAGGGFDAVISNPPEGRMDDREWTRQYLQRRYTVYHPLADRSAYIVERAFALTAPGGTVAMAMSGRFLRGAPGSALRDLLASKRVEEIVDLSGVPAGSPGAGLCLVRARATRPGRSFAAIRAGPGFACDPARYADQHRFPVNQQELDAGGWSFRDTRAEEILMKIARIGTPLDEVVMGQVHAGLRIDPESPFVIDAARAREWMRRDPRCKQVLRPIVPAGGAGPEDQYLILIPAGWTRSHPAAAAKPWQWLKHRHPLIAKHLRPFSDQLCERAGPGALWWETACDEFFALPRKKIFIAGTPGRVVFRYDAGRGIGDETMLAIPSSGLYLAGILCSRLMRFVIDQGYGKKEFSRDVLNGLPVYIPDLDRPEERTIHDRIGHLVVRTDELERKILHAPTDPEREAIRKKIRTTQSKMDTLVYKIYGLSYGEIAVVEGNSPS